MWGAIIEISLYKYLFVWWKDKEKKYQDGQWRRLGGIWVRDAIHSSSNTNSCLDMELTKPQPGLNREVVGWQALQAMGYWWRKPLHLFRLPLFYLWPCRKTYEHRLAAFNKQQKPALCHWETLHCGVQYWWVAAGLVEEAGCFSKTSCPCSIQMG